MLPILLESPKKVIFVLKKTYYGRQKKTELDAKEIYRIQTIMASKANDWYLSHGHICEGMEVFRTPEEGVFVFKDIETGVELGMRKQTQLDGVITQLSFFSTKTVGEPEDELNDQQNQQAEEPTC